MPSATARHIVQGLESESVAAKLDLLLTSGGDERLQLDPVTRRNRYGTLPHPAPDEVWFSSSTATSISERGYKAARAAFSRIASPAPRAANDLLAWFDELRERIVTIMGVPGSEAILSASGTEAEILALTLTKALLRRPLVNIVVARDETGNGVMQAAAGSYFDASATWRTKVGKGARLPGWEDAAIETAQIEIRDEAGQLLPPRRVDQAVAARVEAALAAGCDVLLHVLDASKTGQSGPSRRLAREIAWTAPDRVVVVVDACQLRCSFEELKTDLDSGFLVMVTGSKFAGGPPFCGALLVPPSLIEELRELRAPAGLSAYSAWSDWPVTLRGALCEGPFPAANLGLGLRWEAALAEIEAYAAIAPATRREIARAFGRLVMSEAAKRPHLALLDPKLAAPAERPPTIFPVVTGCGAQEETHRIYRALRAPLRKRRSGSDATFPICHVGQPVTVAGRSALRLCLSMPMTRFIAERLEDSTREAQALAPVAADLRVLFEKWDCIAHNLPADASGLHQPN